MRHRSIDRLHLITRRHPRRHTRQRRLSTLFRQRLVGSHRRAPAFDEVCPVVPGEEERQENTGDHHVQLSDLGLCVISCVARAELQPRKKLRDRLIETVKTLAGQMQAGRRTPDY